MSSDSITQSLLERLDDVIARARAAGTDAADALAYENTSLSASWRLGKLEDVERSEAKDLGLRVFVGRRQAIVSSSDDAQESLGELVERAVAMAREAPEDAYAGLAEPERLAGDLPDLDLDDPDEPTADELAARAGEAEEAGRAVAGVTNSEGAEAGWGRGTIALATSGGFAGAYTTSSHSLMIALVAGSGTGMERDYDWVRAHHGSDLEPPAEIGRTAGQRAVARLNPRKVASAEAPVVYAPRVANGLLRHLAMAVSGTAVARGTSFLKDRMGEQIFAPGITVVDDPRRARGLNSKPVDGEGVATARLKVIEDGTLKTWFLDSATGRQLKLPTTGHASRGTGGPPAPGPTNLYLEPGMLSPEALIADIESGFYVTELSGFGINPVTGDYSRGAAGFWIDKGQIAYPVSELTIAGNLKDMFKALRPASDLRFRYGVDAPTVRIDGMTVGGT